MDGLSILQPLVEYYDMLFGESNQGPQDQITQAVDQCKRLARDVKKQRPSRRCLPADMHRSLPRREVADELIQLYFTTFESCYRILHLPSFKAQYESCIDRPAVAETSFLLQVYLVLSLAGTLHDDPTVRREITTKTRTWIHIAQTWLSAPLEKDRLTLKGIQVHCLLLLARQVNQVGADLVWISAGSLMRMAMQMGLHQNPDYLGEMSVRQKEIRRRLWYTILEMNVQAALDSGMSPMIMDGDYNTVPPSNVSDNELEEPTQGGQRSISNCPQTSFQSLLSRSLSLRLRATRVINSLQEEPSYDQVLSLGNELDLACREATVAIEGAPSNADVPSVSQFASNYCSHLLRRFPLCLHFRYAVKAKANPLYSHSQKACLEAALDIVSLLDDEHYRRLLLVGGGMFRDIITRGALLIFLELCPEPEADTSIFAKKRNRSRQEPLLQDANRVVQYAKERMQHGDMNIKTYVFCSMMMAHAKANLDSMPAKEVTLKAMHGSLETSHNILESMAADASEIAPDLSLETWTSSVTVPPSAGLDANFDFLDDGNLDFNFLDSHFFQSSIGQAWL